MNNDQLQDWLCELHEHFGSSKHQSASTSSPQGWRPILQQLAPQTNLLLNYFLCNFDDSRLSEPLITQLLSLYYKFGIARCFVLQLVPTFIHSYLKALAKHWSASSRMLEMFFLAIYNEEILADGPGTPSMAKKADEIRLPKLRFGGGGNAIQQSMTSKIATPSTIGKMRPSETMSLSVTKGVGSQARLAGGTNTVATSVTTGLGGSSTGGSHKALRSSIRIGPFPAVERISAENRFLILTRLTRTVNQFLPEMAPDVVCRALCHSLLYICRSGFSFQESDFRQRFLRECASSEVFADFSRFKSIRSTQHDHLPPPSFLCCTSRKNRIRGIPSNFLTESINGLTFALLNGQPDIALRALDAVHQRAQYELMADVFLETNALRHAISKSQTMQSILGERNEQQQREAVNGGTEEGPSRSKERTASLAELILEKTTPQIHNQTASS